MQTPIQMPKQRDVFQSLSKLIFGLISVSLGGLGIAALGTFAGVSTPGLLYDGYSTGPIWINPDWVSSLARFSWYILLSAAVYSFFAQQIVNSYFEITAEKLEDNWTFWKVVGYNQLVPATMGYHWHEEKENLLALRPLMVCRDRQFENFHYVVRFTGEITPEVAQSFYVWWNKTNWNFPTFQNDQTWMLTHLKDRAIRMRLPIEIRALPSATDPSPELALQS